MSKQEEPAELVKVEERPSFRSDRSMAEKLWSRRLEELSKKTEIDAEIRPMAL